MCAAAAIGPDRVFCKQIRKLQVTFGIVPPYQDKNYASSRYRDHIQDWEIDRYAEVFNHHYKSNTSKMLTGPILISLDKADAIRYDYKKPNKIVKVPTITGHKKMPQLAYATYFGHCVVVNYFRTVY
jgi:hypothetical protein